MSWDNRNLRCRNCTYWWPVTEGENSEPHRERSDFGQCRRHAPPTTVGEPADHGRHYPCWAVTKRDDWCGEHVHVVS